MAAVSVIFRFPIGEQAPLGGSLATDHLEDSYQLQLAESCVLDQLLHALVLVSCFLVASNYLAKVTIQCQLEYIFIFIFLLLSMKTTLTGLSVAGHGWPLINVS